MVACYSSTSCGGGTSIGSMTVRQCCVDTEGLSYFGRSGCTICSCMFGSIYSYRSECMKVRLASYKIQACLDSIIVRSM